jgi:exopolysaccharide biosynthesis predicted pyruvyltransferase EpsI
MRKNGNKKSKKAAENTHVESENAAVHAKNAAVHPENVVTAKENILATTPKRVTWRYYNSFMNPLQFFHENATIHYNSFMLQPTCYPTWRREIHC